MEAKTLTPDADAEAAEESETLAAGELVWAKPSKRGRHCWWPARMLAACPASAARDAQVSYLADPTASPSGGAPSAPPAWLRRFAHADADKMAGGSVAAGFLWAVREAQARAVAALQAQLTCACVPPPPSGEDEDCSVAGVANLAPAEFLAALREAALGASSVGLVDLVRLKSWARAVGDGWGPHGAEHYPRRRPEELVDKIDLDVPAGEDRDAEDWLAEDQHKALVLVRPEETPKQKKRSLSKMMDKRDAAEDEGKIDSAEHVTSGSGKRQRKKSKYLSPPYTDLGMFDKSACKPVDLPKAFVPKAAEDGRNVSARKPVNLPKALVLKAAEDDRNVSARKPVNLPKALVLKAAEDGRNVSPLPGSIVVEDVLLLVRGLGKVPYYTDDFPKDAEEFLRLFRSTKFIRGADYKSCKAHESPVMRGSRNVVMNIAVGVLSGSDAVLKQGSCVSKRGKKKDEAENSGSSVKRKKWEKASPAATSREKDEAESGGTSIKRKKWEKTSPAATIGASTPRKKDEAESGGSSIKRKKREKTSPAATIGASTPRKKDEAESGGSSIKRKKQEKTSPAATIGAGITITHALPIRQMEAEDIKTLMKVGSGPRGIGVGVQNEKGKPSPLKLPISAADPGAAESGHERAPNVLAVGNTLPEQSAKENDAANLEATRSEMNVQNVTVHMPIRSVQTEAMELQANNPIEVTAQSVSVDFPVGSVSKEATERETCVQEDRDVRSNVSDVPDRIVSKEPTELETDVQSVAADVSTRSVLKEATMPNADIRVHDNLQSAGDLLVSSGLSPMHEDMSQPVDGNKEPVRVEVCTVQQSYASLQAMVPEMLDKVNPNGTDTIGVNDTLKDEFQKDGQPVKKVELAAEVANHSCGEGANGTWLAPCNLTPKKKKKAAQHFSNPAAIIVEFERDTIVPSREELLSTFGKYGYLIESQTDISETTRSACVVFGKSIEAEEAYKSGCQYLLGQFGPPFAKLRLDFSPIKLTLPSPSLASKPPLGDIRKNLEDMISARRSALNKATSSDGQLNPVPDKLLGEMQGLLAKVERMLTRPPANAP